MGEYQLYRAVDWMHVFLIFRKVSGFVDGNMGAAAIIRKIGPYSLSGHVGIVAGFRFETAVVFP